MNAMTLIRAGEVERPVRFTGSWRTYLPIVLTNLALTIVTLGIYRFWAKARERRYLWANTRLLDGELEWSGTGSEMLIGFLFALPVFVPIIIAVGVGVPVAAAKLPWHWIAAVAVAAYAIFYFFVSFARYRALRYRLGRTWWHGIRGGGSQSGLHYAAKALGWYGAAALSVGILFPWTQARLWNERWRSMSFGSIPIEANMTTEAVRLSWAAVWICFIVGNAVLTLITIPGIVVYGPGAPQLVLPLLIYAAMGLAYLGFLAAFYRSAVEGLTYGGLTFTLEADFNDWLLFTFRTILLTVATLGVAILFYSYRKWRFLVTRLEIHGDLDLVALERSTLRGTRDAEGFADAFDIGAF